MKLIYLAGPFRGPDSWAIACNVHKAAELSLQVWRMGAACICPHLNSAQFQGAAPDDVWLAGDIEILRRCDAVILTDDWKRSSGARAEVAEAFRLFIPVFTQLADLEEWLRQIESERKQYFDENYTG